jgi:hypothetical protein
VGHTGWDARCSPRLISALSFFLLPFSFLSPAARAGHAGPPPPTKLPNLLATDYTFSRNFPRYTTSYVALRNPKKLRPLFISGRGNDGMLYFRPLEMDRLGKIAQEVDMDNLAGLAEVATGRGVVSVQLDNYSHSASDQERTVGTDWLLKDPRPPLILEIQSLVKWGIQDTKQAGRVVYRAEMRGALKAGGRSVPLAQEATVTVIEATVESEPMVVVRWKFAFQGAELGLTGDDAGEIQAQVMMAGYLNVRGTDTKAALDKAMREKEKEAREILDDKLRDSSRSLDLDIDRK